MGEPILGKLVLFGLMVAFIVPWMGSGHAEAQTVASKSGIAASQELPPIECPLRKAGIDPTKLKPFEEVEKYIQFLERADRAQWQKPDEVVKALGLKGSEIVVDLGAGPGYFTFRLATALPQGRVVAIDSQAEMARHVHRKVLTEGIRNIQAQVAKSEDDPGLPAGADLVFVCDKYSAICGIKLHPHLLRHSFAHQFLEDNPGDLVALAQVLGHENLNTTRRYVQRAEEQLSATCERLTF